MEEVLVGERLFRISWSPMIFISRAVSAAVGIIEFLLMMRIIMVFLGASSGSTFVAWVYDTTDSFMGPFVGAFSNWIIGGFVFDITAIFAMIGYGIIAGFLMGLISFISDSI